MAHKQQQDFFRHIKGKYPDKFRNSRVLDVGSLDINGSNRYLFEGGEYIGMDLGEGKNVDIVSLAHEYKPSQKFDTIISGECFEHDFFYKDSVKNCINLLNHNGLFLFSCATTNRPEHGTPRTNHMSSPFTSQMWGDYYKNLTEKDFKSIEGFNKLTGHFETARDEWDLFYFGIKK